MKKFLVYTFIISSFISLLSSCNPDDNDGEATDPRNKFVGNWTCNETSTENGGSSFSVTVSLNTGNSSQILLSNFYHVGPSCTVYAVVAGDNITVPEQPLSTLTVKNGSGSIYSNNNKMSWNYNVNVGADIDNCTAEFIRQ